jgi:hypothetical protein
MILQSHTVFDQLAELDPFHSSVQYLSLKRYPELKASIVGTFSVINEIMVSFYRLNGILYFRVADQKFEVTEEVISTLAISGNNRKFRLLKGDDVVVDVTYSTPELEIPLSIDPTPFVEEEDFDFLLFVHNVLTQPGRRNRIWNQ